MVENAELRSNDEAARILAVQRYQIVDVSADAEFARITDLAAQIFDAPMAAVSIVDRDQIWLAAAYGVRPGVRQIPRDDGLCASVILSDTPHVVDDALTDSRTANNRFVQEHQIRFYAAAPIVTFDGHRLGAVAVMDHDARTASTKDLAVLENLAAIVMEQLELRLSSLGVLRAEQTLRGTAEYDRDEAQRDLNTAERERDNAQRDRDLAQVGRDDAVRDRGTAERDRDLAQVGRDDAVRDRDIAERDRDLILEYATVLQRTLLPPSLPHIDGVSLGSYFRPASPRRVGGDFYDVFPLGGTRWGFFLGDVLGHGPEAATVTSLIRYTLRSAALHYRDLTRGLAELNSVLLREAEPRRFCTVLFGTLEPHESGEGFHVTIATGGHEPALLLDPISGTVDEVRPSDGMLVGALPSATFAACSVHLRNGQTLMSYTDGLIEARRGPSPFDHDSLSAFAVEHAAGGAQGLIDDIAALVPKLNPRDDIAVLAMEDIST